MQFSIQGLSNLQEGEVPCKGPVTEASGGAREQHGGHGERGQKGKHQAGNVAGATRGFSAIRRALIKTFLAVYLV